jgi:hypothetical protein
LLLERITIGTPQGGGTNISHYETNHHERLRQEWMAVTKLNVIIIELGDTSKETKQLKKNGQNFVRVTNYGVFSNIF